MQRAIFDLNQAETLQQAAQQSVDLLRELLGCDRVKIYRFLEDWTGEVITESKADHMDSFVGLRFPSSDIPAQARKLYRILPYRLLLTAQDDRNAVVHLDGAQARMICPNPSAERSAPIIRRTRAT